MLWLRGWAFDKFIPLTMRWYEIDNHDHGAAIAPQGRYRYYLTGRRPYPKGRPPARAGSGLPALGS